VRKGAVDLITAIIKANKNFHTTIIEKYANQIIKRFKERTVEVKVQLLESFNILILANIEENYSNSVDLELRNMASFKNNSSFGGAIGNLSAFIVSTIGVEIQNKNFKVRVECLKTLSNLTATIKFAMDEHFEMILPELEKAAVDSTSSTGPDPLLKSLEIMRRLFRSRNDYQKANFLKYIPNI